MRFVGADHLPRTLSEFDHIAREPEAHQLAAMTNPEDARFMHELADFAAAFIYDGAIVI